jgi:hypothetical protein
MWLSALCLVFSRQCGTGPINSLDGHFLVRGRMSRNDYLIRAIQNELALGRDLQMARRVVRDSGIFTDEEIETAIKHCSSFDLEPGRAESLRGDLRTPWYTSDNEAAASHWGLLKSVLRTKSAAWSPEMIGQLNSDSDTILSAAANPKSHDRQQIKGLVLGYIQSGKTANFSAVIAKGIDAGYKLVVVLSGVHNNLRLQTQTRLHEELVAPNESACTTLTRVDSKGDFQRRQSISANRALAAKEGFTLVVLKKNSSVLRSFSGWLSEARRDVLESCPTLVIDDESDHASINTNSPELSPTAINKHIRNVLDYFQVVTYVGYTATPFANVLIDSEDSSDLYPKDFLISLPKPPTYFGAEELFGRDEVSGHPTSTGIPVVRIVSKEDAHIFRAAAVALPGGIPTSLQKAIDSFILASAVRLSRGQWRDHMTMLVHVSHLIAKQEILFQHISDDIAALKTTINENAVFRSRLESLWTTDFIPVGQSFGAGIYPSFPELWKNVPKVVEQLECIMDNSAAEERLTFAGPDKLRAIVIGGNTLSRGLTLEGLLTSYFVRSSRNYDSLLQMGRWFGYRPGYVDLTRLFTTSDLYDSFFHLATVEQEIRDEISVMAQNQEKPIDVGLRIRSHPTMSVTSANKMRHSFECSLTYSGSKIQARYINTNNAKVQQGNLDAVIDLMKGASKLAAGVSQSHFREYASSKLFRGVPSELILQFIDSFKFSAANTKFERKLLSDYISDLAEAGELHDWSIAMMSAQSGEVLELPGHSKIFLLERSALRNSSTDIDPESVQLRSLSAPGDELIDLGDRIPNHLGSVELLLQKGTERTSEVQLRREWRPKERGLLILYPLNPKQSQLATEASSHFSLTEPIRATHPVFGVAFVFPHTNSPRSRHIYIANQSL